MGSMHTGLEEEKQGFSKLAAFYEERAKGGVGLIITGGISPNCRGNLVPFGSLLSWFWQGAKHKQVTVSEVNQLDNSVNQCVAQSDQGIQQTVVKSINGYLGKLGWIIG